jgi:hypothetical protein
MEVNEESILGTGAPQNSSENVQESVNRLILKTSISFAQAHAIKFAITDMWGVQRKVYPRPWDKTLSGSRRKQFELVSKRHLEGWALLGRSASRSMVIEDCLRRKAKGLLLPYVGDIRSPCEVLFGVSREYSIEYMHTGGVEGNSFYDVGFNVDASNFRDVTRDPFVRPDIMDAVNSNGARVEDIKESRAWFPACTANHTSKNPNCAFVLVPVEVFCPHLRGGASGVGETCDVVHLTLIQSVESDTVLEVNYGSNFTFSPPAEATEVPANLVVSQGADATRRHNKQGHTKVQMGSFSAKELNAIMGMLE